MSEKKSRGALKTIIISAIIGFIIGYTKSVHDISKEYDIDRESPMVWQEMYEDIRSALKLGEEDDFYVSRYIFGSNDEYDIFLVKDNVSNVYLYEGRYRGRIDINRSIEEKENSIKGGFRVIKINNSRKGIKHFVSMKGDELYIETEDSYKYVFENTRNIEKNFISGKEFFRVMEFVDKYKEKIIGDKSEEVNFDIEDKIITEREKEEFLSEIKAGTEVFLIDEENIRIIDRREKLDGKYLILTSKEEKISVMYRMDTEGV